MSSKAAKKKSWREKLADSKGLPKVVEITGRMSKKWGEGTVVVPAPIEVDELMRKVPKGKVTTINHIRNALALKYQATICCPITTGIFAWIAAHASAETESAGGKRFTPWWRTLKLDAALNPKYPGGLAVQMKRLKSEGLIVKRGAGKKPPLVADYAKSLYDPARRSSAKEAVSSADTDIVGKNL